LQALREDGIEAVACDVTVPDSIAACVTEVLEKAGAVHILINNAGL
jgi:NAD(P)-dependent dehydrogenase (short-subunit alcohol dehydrogenase family)